MPTMQYNKHQLNRLYNREILITLSCFFLEKKDTNI